MKRIRAPFLRTYGAPAGIAAVSLAGLVAALLTEGVGDIVFACAVAVPLVVSAWALVRRRS